MPLSSSTRFTALGSGEVDVLYRTSTQTMLRDATLGLRFATVSEVPTPWICLANDLRLAGIDPATGFPVAAGALHEPAAARDDITVTTEPAGRSRPQAGSVDARGDDEASDDLDAIRDRILEQLRQSAMTAADIGVTAS